MTTTTTTSQTTKTTAPQQTTTTVTMTKQLLWAVIQLKTLKILLVYEISELDLNFNINAVGSLGSFNVSFTTHLPLLPKLYCTSLDVLICLSVIAKGPGVQGYLRLHIR